MASEVGGFYSSMDRSNGDKDPIPFNYEERLLAIRTLLPSDVTLGTGPFCKHPLGVFLRRKCVVIPYEMLLLPKHFPLEFKVTSSEDSRLFDIEFLKKFGAYCAQLHTCFSGLDLNEAGQCRRLQELLLLLQDSEHYNRAVEFTLAHENAHIQHAKGLGIWMLKCYQKLDAAEITARCFFRKFISLNEYSLNSYSIQEERQCDMDAATAMGDASGGIYWWQTLHNWWQTLHNLDIVKANHDGTDKNHALSPPTHPSELQRIDYLQAWQDWKQDCNDQPAALEFPDELIAQLR